VRLSEQAAAREREDWPRANRVRRKHPRFVDARVRQISVCGRVTSLGQLQAPLAILQEKKEEKIALCPRISGGGWVREFGAF